MKRPERRVMRGRAMIVAPQPEAVEAGADVLRDGGSAMDAVLACAFAQGVVDPLMCGLGGLGVLQVFDPATGRHEVWDGLSTCAAAARPEMWADRFERECADGYGYVLRGAVNELGHGAVTTPGVARLLAAAHAGYGRTPWAALFGPAIGLARDGWAVRPHVHAMMVTDEAAYGRQSYVAKLSYSPEAARLYLRPDGTPRRVGEVVRNPDLAATLALVARDGAEVVHTGEIARLIAEDMRAHGGLVAYEDLAGFGPRRHVPMQVAYRGRRVALPPPPAGGIVVAQMLRLLEGFDLVALGHNSAAYVAVLAEAMKIALRDREAHVGDPDFTPVPQERLLSDAYVGDCAARIRAGEKASLVLAGGESQHTTTVSAIDADGMVVTLTHTLGAPSGVIPPGTGFMLNGAMNWYDPRPGRPGSIAPGKRRFSSMSPTIVFEGDAPVLTVGAPGAAWIGVAILQVLVNVLDWGMTMQEAVMAPRVSATSDAIDISNRVPRGVQAELAGMGYQVRRSPQSFPFAAPHGIACWDGVLEGGADPQRDGYVAAVA